MIKKILMAALALMFVAGGIAYYLYNKPVSKTESKSTDLVITAENLFAEYNADETVADQKYLNKTVEVTGAIMGTLLQKNVVTGVQLSSGVADAGIICEFENEPGKTYSRFPVGDVLTLKCVCTGKLMDVVLTRCVIVQK
ncbi:MAG: hypothetical protein IPM48_03475 [Saprospiraceae bacterium]|nr:hypothetical protein [Saprospiraceae bacterium]